MMTTFSEARKTVSRELSVATLPTGYEDDEDYNVLLAVPATDDQVNLVSKRTGKLHRENFFAMEDKLEAMSPVKDEDH